MPRSPQTAPVGEPSSSVRRRRRLAIWGLFAVGLGLAGALIWGPRYSERQRLRREAAERQRWALAAQAPRSTPEEAGERPREPVDSGPMRLAELRRSVVAVAQGDDPGQPEATGAAPGAATRSAAARQHLGARVAQPGLPWLPPLWHGAPIQDAGLSPDGSLLLTAGADGVVHIRAGQSGEKLAELRLPPRAGAVQLARFSPDGARVVTGSADGGVQLWEARTGRALLTARLDLPPGALRDAAFAPDGRLLLVATATGTGYLLDSRTGALAHKLSGHRDEVTMGSFSPDGTRVLTASADGTIRLFSASGAALAVGKAHPLGARVARFSPDGSLIVTAGNEATARVFDARTLARIAELHGHHSEVLSVRFSPDGAQLVTASADGTALLWDSRSGRLAAALVGHTHPLSDAMFAPDGAAVLTAAVDGEVRLWSNPGSRTVAVLRGHRARLTALGFTSDGERLLTAGLDGSVRLWTARPLASAAAELVIRHPQLAAARLSPSGDTVVTFGRDGVGELWDARDGKHRRTLLGHAYAVNAAVFTPDGLRLLTVSDDGSLRVWDARSGLTLHTLLGHTHPVRGVSVSPDGSLAATVDLAGTARLWSVRDGQALALLAERQLAGQRVAAALFSPDGERLVTVHSPGTALLWNVHTLGLQASLPPESALHAVAFSPDGSRLLTAGPEPLVRLWDARAAGSGAAPVATLSGHGGELQSARFSPDGQHVVTAATDHTSRLWDVATQQAVATLGEHAGAVRLAAFSPDGLQVLSGDSEGLAVVWEAATGQVARRLTGKGAVLAAEFSADGQSVLVGREDGAVHLTALSIAPMVRGACRLLRNHPAQWAQVAALCQPWLREPGLIGTAPIDGGLRADPGLWAAPLPPDAGAAEAPAWRRDIAARSHEIPAGCFAYSAKLHAAACRTRHRATAGSPSERVLITFVPPVFPAIAIEPEVGERVEPRCPPLAFGPTLTALQTRLLSGDFVPIAASAYRPLREGPELQLGSSGAYFSWQPARATARLAARGPQDHKLQVRCSSGKRIVLQTYQSPKEELTAAVAPLADGKRLIFRLTLSTPEATPGPSGARLSARQEKVVLLDPRSCATQTSADPDLL